MEAIDQGPAAVAGFERMYSNRAHLLEELYPNPYRLGA
jgi:hypothetical protein